MEFFEQVRQTFKRMDERLGLMESQVKGLREDVQSVGGAFAGIEAMLVATAAREADMLGRIEALEKKAS
ncbi:MAG: hypothetical protein FJX76_27270 [Armatimonadetes bacterium]|nr:hypothetical protein [Armatimonadota bacterium]